MKVSPFRIALLVLGASGLAAHGAATAQPNPQQQAAEFFQKKIVPIFSEACYKCHSNAEGKSKGGLTLDTRDGILKGGDDGKIVVPGDPAKSMLIQKVTSKDKDEIMPPKETPLTAAQVADLAAWIKMGAPVPATVSLTKKDDAKETGAIFVRQNPEARKHWAWQPIRVPAIPPVRNPAAVKTPVDSFIEAKLERVKLRDRAIDPPARTHLSPMEDELLLDGREPGHFVISVATEMCEITR
jgi:hypothetical protein